MPPAEQADEGLPSFDDLRELEATGRPDAFSHLPPPVLEVERLPFSRSNSTRGTSIADADPVRAAAVAKEKEKMSRRAMMAGGGGIIGGFGFGGVWLVLRIIGKSSNAYNRQQERKAREESESDRRR